MESRSPSRFNPYIVGQLTLLLGGIALGLASIPPQLLQCGADSDTEFSTATAELQQRLKPYRVAAMTLAIVGLCLGPIGWRREDPPLLPICGMTICGVALFWQWIVTGVTLAVLVIALLIAVFVYFQS